MKTKDEMDTTSNSTVYKKVRKKYLEETGEIDCSWCPYHKFDNYSKRKVKRNWKKFRKKQYKIKEIDVMVA